MIDAGLLVPGERLVWDRPRKGERWFATVTETVVSVWMTAPNIRLRPPRPVPRRRRRGGGLDVWKRTRNGQKLSDIWKQFRLQAQ